MLKIFVGTAGLAAALLVSATPTLAKSLLVDISACANDTFNFGQPVGKTTGNAGTEFSAIKFNLIDFATTNNFWRGVGGGSMNIELAVPQASAVQILINTGWGQSDIPNALVIIKGTGGVKKTFKLIGNKTIRDYNNWIFTNSINGTTTQEWWTNNLNPQPNDQTHRYDAYVVDISSLLGSETLTQITVKAPDDAAQGFMEPLVFAVNVKYPGERGPKPTCVAKSGS